MSRDRIDVKLNLGSKPLAIGTLVQDEQKIYFRCAAEYLDAAFDVSPFKLSKSSGVQTVETAIFGGLHGVFADSLPDGWGRLILDRALAERGIDAGSITPLDRLAYVGQRGMGALSYHPVHSTGEPVSPSIDLDRIASDSAKLLAGQSVDVLEELVELGGSSGGARPKIVVGYNPTTDKMMPDSGSLPEGFEHWLIKFPAAIDPAGIANVEMAYHRMAVASGLEMMPCRLFTGSSGRTYFGTRRFDRNGSQRLHLHSAAGLMHDNFRLPNMDYGHVMDAALRLEKSIEGPAKVLRLAAFNVFARNRDDHSKNISFLMDDTGSWRLAPAYDLTYAQSGHGYHSMMVAGEGRSPGRKQLMELAREFGVAHPEQIIEEVREGVAGWRGFAEAVGVPEVLVEGISG